MGIKREDLPRRARAYVDATELAARKAGAGKYRNRWTRSDIIGRNFQSDGERRMAEYLYAMEQAGDISDLKFQVQVKLLGCVTMRPDFSYVEDGELIIHEFKGFPTDTWRMQKKLWALVGPGPYRISRAGQLWPASEIIIPRVSDELIGMVLQALQRDGYGGVFVDKILMDLS